jgi:hypothetical protein
MKLCCDALTEMLENAGKRGLSVVPLHWDDIFYFCIQARACNYEDEKDLIKIRTENSLKINMSFQTGIKYCPFCGMKLANWIEENKQNFLNNTGKYKKYLLD